MAGEKYIARINGFIEPYLGKNGYSLIRTEFVSEDGNWFLRLFIDLTEAELEKRNAEREEDQEEPGVSINDCIKVSRYLSKWLDKEDFIKEAYTMEVCSKGFLEEAQTAGEEGESE